MQNGSGRARYLGRRTRGRRGHRRGGGLSAGAECRAAAGRQRRDDAAGRAGLGRRRRAAQCRLVGRFFRPAGSGRACRRPLARRRRHRCRAFPRRRPRRQRRRPDRPRSGALCGRGGARRGAGRGGAGPRRADQDRSRARQAALGFACGVATRSRPARQCRARGGGQSARRRSRIAVGASSISTTRRSARRSPAASAVSTSPSAIWSRPGRTARC